MGKKMWDACQKTLRWRCLNRNDSLSWQGAIYCEALLTHPFF